MQFDETQDIESIDNEQLNYGRNILLEMRFRKKEE